MNPLTTIRDALSKRTADRQQTALQKYAALIVDLADNKTRDDHNTIETILAETGRTVDDIEADVADLKDRRSLAAQSKGRADLKRQRDAIQTQIDESADAVEAAKTAHDDLVAELLPQRVALDAPITQCDGAIGRLMKANMVAAQRGLARVEPAS